MKTVAVIQARMGSTRLPGKVLMDVVGTTMLERVVRKTLRSTRIEEVVVATSTNANDEVIEKECDRIGVGCYRGSEDDVLDRYYKAASSFDASVVVRITSDCPLIDPAIVDKAVDELVAGDADYSSNTVKRTYPRGLDTEAMRIEALESACKEASKNYQREHVTPYIYQNPDKFRLHFVTNDTDHSALRWTVDTPEDLEFVRAVYRHFEDRGQFGWLDVLALVDTHPEIALLNSQVRQKDMETDSA